MPEELDPNSLLDRIRNWHQNSRKVRDRRW